MTFKYEITLGKPNKTELGHHFETPELCNPSIAHLQGALWLQGTLSSLVRRNPHTGSQGSREDITLVYKELTGSERLKSCLRQHSWS